MQTFGEINNAVNETADIVRYANEEIEALQHDIANLIAAGEQAMRALIELDGGDPTNETGWDDDLACQAWKALTVAIGIAKHRASSQ